MGHFFFQKIFSSESLVEKCFEMYSSSIFSVHRNFACLVTQKTFFFFLWTLGSVILHRWSVQAALSLHSLEISLQACYSFF